jgi:lipoprotein NlpD
MRRIALCLGLLLLVGCATQGRPLITERAQPPDARVQIYSVRKGDTLYSIAWRFGLDVKQLAARNGLRAPYTIYPGQRLRLRGGAATASKPSATRQPRPAKPAVAPGRPPTFAWPVAARPSREFGRGNKGLDFSIAAPTRVAAAAPGTVVYSGTGLGGYQTFVIIRHAGGYLSAYGFNAPAAVAEGKTVKVGERLADIGGTGRAAKLHFEIRKDGEPISPRSVLR